MKNAADYILKLFNFPRKQNLVLSGDNMHEMWNPGPSCSKLTTSLVNDSLKFSLSDTQIC